MTVLYRLSANFSLLGEFKKNTIDLYKVHALVGIFVVLGLDRWKQDYLTLRYGW
jgi:hypothetical protein